jgi:hypothetical protein
MKITRAVITVASILSAALVGTAQADVKNKITNYANTVTDTVKEQVGYMYFKPEVAYVLPVDGDVDDTVFVGAKVGYQWDDNWALEAESGWMEYGYDATKAVQNLDVTTIPVLGNLRYGERCSDDEMGWYGYAGAGWAFNDLEDNVLGTRADGSFAWQIGAGIEIPVATGLDLFFDLRYLWNRANVDIENGAPRVSADDIVLSSVLFATGVKF